MFGLDATRKKQRKGPKGPTGPLQPTFSYNSTTGIPLYCSDIPKFRKRKCKSGRVLSRRRGGIVCASWRALDAAACVVCDIAGLEMVSETVRLKLAAFEQMCDAISKCCARFCDCFLFNLLRRKSTFYVLMFLCFFWATFSLVLSSTTLNQVYDRDAKRATKDIPICNPADACARKSCGTGPVAYPEVVNPFEFYVNDKSGNQILKMTCTWPQGNNISRFGCAIFDIIVFLIIGWYSFWVLRECTPFPQNTKTFHVILFLAADGWWWFNLVSDAILIVRASDACSAVTRRFTNNANSTVGSVRVFHLIRRLHALTLPLQCPNNNNLFYYTVLCDAACAVFFLLLTMSTFM
jgi:hypothetical protein